MGTIANDETKSFSSRRRFGIAGAAALAACAACCAVPLLVTIGLGSAAVTALSAVFRPGAELVVGVTTFAGALGVMAMRRKLARHHQCVTVCKGEGDCCDGGGPALESGERSCLGVMV